MIYYLPILNFRKKVKYYVESNQDRTFTELETKSLSYNALYDFAIIFLCCFSYSKYRKNVVKYLCVYFWSIDYYKMDNIGERYGNSRF